MGSRMADSEALVTRCRRAGWTVVRSTRGYKVYDGAGIMHSIHLTYSDVKSLMNAEQELDRAGLSDDEKTILSARLTENRTRNDIARTNAEKRAQVMANGASLARAAGPYLVEAEDVGLEWLISPHPRPWMRWANITPEIAAKILKDHNADNRPLSAAVVQHYRDIILAGLWHLTHQGLAFDVRGMLQDGQHRLNAIVEAGKLMDEPLVVPAAVFVGMPMENFKAIDEGALRTARQLFSKGGEKNTGSLQTCVRLVYYYQDGDARKAARLRLPNQVILDQFARDGDEYRTSVQFAASAYLKIPGVSNPALAAAHFLIRRTNGTDNDYVIQFFDALTTGLIPGTRTVLDDDDPRRAFRAKMANIKERVDRGDKKERRSALTQVGMIIQTWNNMVGSRRIRHLYFNDDNIIPEVLRCTPGAGAVPALFLSPKARGAL
jgi:hypothetical protein